MAHKVYSYILALLFSIFGNLFDNGIIGCQCHRPAGFFGLRIFEKWFVVVKTFTFNQTC